MVNVDPVDEPILLSEHDPRWRAWFVDERERLARRVPAGSRIEHVGSTAVPKLVAKPIVDILIGLPEGTQLESVAAKLVELGYEALGEAGVPGRIHLRRRGGRAFNLSVVPLESSLWRDNLLFREHLRTNREARQRYADVKQRAIEAGCTSLLDYSDFKGPTVEMLVAEATAAG